MSSLINSSSPRLQSYTPAHESLETVGTSFTTPTPSSSKLVSIISDEKVQSMYAKLFGLGLPSLESLEKECKTPEQIDAKIREELNVPMLEKASRTLPTVPPLSTCLGTPESFLSFLEAIRAYNWACVVKKLYPNSGFNLSTMESVINVGQAVFTELLNDGDRITKLDLSNAGFTVLPIEVLKLKNLRTLNLKGNYLSTLPPQFKTLTSLEFLDLRENPISLSEIKWLRVLTAL